MQVGAVKAEGEFRADAVKNPSSRFHATMRQLAHALALASDAPGWAEHLAECAEQLRPLAQWVHGALDYLALPSNLTAWPLQRCRAHVLRLLARCPPRTLALLAAQHGAARQKEGRHDLQAELERKAATMR